MKNFKTGLIIIVLPAILLTGGGLGSAQGVPDYSLGKLIYENPLSREKDLAGVVIESSEEGQPEVRFVDSEMHIKSSVHFLLWFPPDLPADISVSWNFTPEVDDGLAMFWFCANGKDGKDLFDPSLQERTGSYPQYHSGDINAYHLSYFRRNPWDDPTMNTVNLRKSHGNQLVAMGANPIPNVEVEKVASALESPYRIRVVKCAGWIRMEINDLPVLELKDEDPYKSGKIGFRQMANLEARYSGLRVHEVEVIQPGLRTTADGITTFTNGITTYKSKN